jgi:hypothetical protein
VDEKRGPRRARRALTEEEISRLLTATAARPLREAMTIRHGPRRGEHGAKVRDEVRNQLVLLGRERVLVYKTLILTGLRKSELANLRWSDLHLDEASPWLKVRAEIAKNARSAAIPLRSIPAKDADGRVVDVHALRHTTASYLASAGVPPRTAQALMRHSDIRLTLGTYSDPQLLDTAAALHALPKMDGEKPTETASAGGQKLGAQLGVFLGGTGSTDRHHVSSNGRQSLRKRQPKSNGKSGEEGTYDSRRHRLTPPAEKRAIGFEPTTSSLGSWHSTTELRPQTRFCTTFSRRFALHF